MKTRFERKSKVVHAAAVVAVMGISADAALIHYYKFDEGSGTNVMDEVVVNPQHGTFGSGKNPTNDWVDSPLVGGGTALRFNGVRGDGNADVPPNSPPDREPVGIAQDVVRMSDDASFQLTDVGTVMFWMYQEPGPNGDLAYPTGGAVDNSDNANWIVVYGVDPFNYILHNQPSQGLNMRVEWRTGVSTGTDLRSANSGLALPVEEWVHVAGSWDTSMNGGNGKKSLYVNGVEVDTADFFEGVGDGGAPGNGNSWPGPFTVGGHDTSTGTGRGYLGRIDELKVFDTFLTAEEVLAEIAAVPLPPPGFIQVGSGDTTFFEYQSQVGSNYVLQVSNTVSGVFEDTGSSQAGDGTVQTIYDPNGFDPAADYRILEN